MQVAYLAAARYLRGCLLVVCIRIYAEKKDSEMDKSFNEYEELCFSV
jgi:hypothetical protein